MAKLSKKLTELDPVEVSSISEDDLFLISDYDRENDSCVSRKMTMLQLADYVVAALVKSEGLSTAISAGVMATVRGNSTQIQDILTDGVEDDLVLIDGGNAGDSGRIVARAGGMDFQSFQDALDAVAEADLPEAEIELLEDASIRTSKDGDPLGGPNARKITIYGSGQTLNVVQTQRNSRINTNGAELVLSGVSLTNSRTYTPSDNPLIVPNHDIAFNCRTTLVDVSSDKALAFWEDARLERVSVKDPEDAYSVWIHTTASDVQIDGLSVDGFRGIKIEDAFAKEAGEQPSEYTNLSLVGSSFKTTKKSAVLVGSASPVSIAASDVDISQVAKDSVNLVWVDEAHCEDFGLTELNGGQDGVVPEPAGDYKASFSADGRTLAWYKDFGRALSALNSSGGEQLTLALQADAQVSTSKDGSPLGGASARKITIVGSGKTLTVDQTERNARFNTSNGAELELTDVKLTNVRSYTPSDNPLIVPNHDIAFNCPVSLKDVESDKALAFWCDATLDGVAVREAEDAYSVWIHTTAGSVSTKDLVIDTTEGRGIKIDDAFAIQIGETPTPTSLSLDGATFTTKNRKSAVLVGSSQTTTITTAGTIDFSGVPADTEHLVWVDEAHCEDFGKTTLNGGQDGIIPEPDNYAATTPGAGGTISGYHKTL